MICCERDNNLGAGLSALVEPAPDTGCRKMGVLHIGNIFPWNLRSRWPGALGPICVLETAVASEGDPSPAPATVYRCIGRPGERPGQGSSSTSRCVMSPQMPQIPHRPLVPSREATLRVKYSMQLLHYGLDIVIIRAVSRHGSCGFHYSARVCAGV